MTSAVSVPAAAGIPVTHRGITASFVVASAHEGAHEALSALRDAPVDSTLVLLMGVSALRATAESLGAATLGETAERLGPFPITVDASAEHDGLALALRSTALDGTCTSTAIYFGEQPALPLLEMYTKCTTFYTGRAHVRGALVHGVNSYVDNRRARRASR